MSIFFSTITIYLNLSQIINKSKLFLCCILDVIGHVAAVGNVVHGERKGKPNRRMVIELEDIE